PSALSVMVYDAVSCGAGRPSRRSSTASAAVPVGVPVSPPTTVALANVGRCPTPQPAPPIPATTVSTTAAAGPVARTDRLQPDPPPAERTWGRGAPPNLAS